MNLDQDSYFKIQKTKIRSEKGWVGFFCLFLFYFVFLPLFDLSISNEGTSELKSSHELPMEKFS